MKKLLTSFFLTLMAVLAIVPFAQIAKADDHNAFNYISNVATPKLTTLYNKDDSNNFTAVKNRSLGAKTNWYTDMWIQSGKETYLRVSTNEWARMSDVVASLKLAASGEPHITGVTVTANPAAIIYDDFGAKTIGRLEKGYAFKADQMGYFNNDTQHTYFRVGTNQWVSNADVNPY